MLIFNNQYEKFLKQADNYKNNCNVIPPDIATCITDINFELIIFINKSLQHLTNFFCVLSIQPGGKKAAICPFK